MPAPFLTLSSQDDELNRVQSNLRSALDPLSKDPLLNRVEVESTIKTAVTTVIQHNLGRQPRGWILVDKQGPYDVWRIAWNASTITLDSSGDVKVKVLIY